MSFVRWSAESALYVFADTRGGVTCCGCLLVAEDAFPWGNYNTTDLPTMLAHVARHRARGDTVPDGLETTLTEEWPEEYR